MARDADKGAKYLGPQDILCLDAIKSRTAVHVSSPSIESRGRGSQHSIALGMFEVEKKLNIISDIFIYFMSSSAVWYV